MCLTAQLEATGPTPIRAPHEAVRLHTWRGRLYGHSQYPFSRASLPARASRHRSGPRGHLGQRPPVLQHRHARDRGHATSVMHNGPSKPSADDKHTTVRCTDRRLHSTCGLSSWQTSGAGFFARPGRAPCMRAATTCKWPCCSTPPRSSPGHRRAVTWCSPSMPREEPPSVARCGHGSTKPATDGLGERVRDPRQRRPGRAHRQPPARHVHGLR